MIMQFDKIKKWARRLVFVVLAIGIAWLFFYGTYEGYLRRHRIDVLSNLQEVVATVDEEDLTFEDLGFYILFQERRVEQEAEVYNKDRTSDFWNIHTNGFFLKAQAKEAVIQMAIHDRIFYREAVKNGIVISSDEKQLLENARTDFWSDLYDSQLERIPGTYESVNETMRQIAYAEKYQARLAEEMETTYGGLNWSGYDYQQIRDNEHKVKIYDRVWRRVILGEITLNHDSVSYLNAFDKKDEASEK